MQLHKKLLISASVCALTAANALPALALENEFHGMFRVRGIISNFDSAAAGTATLDTKHPGTSNYIEQRARLMYIAKANDDLKLVTHFEIDSRWGDNSYNSNNTTRNNGGAIGADQVNLETKNVYLDFNIPSAPVNVKLGLQAWNLGYKGIILNDDQAGVSATAKLENGTVSFAYFRLDDALSGGSHIANGSGTATTTATGATSVVNTTPGNRTRDFLTLGGKYNLGKSLKVGADYVLLYSDILRNSQDRTNIHMVGVNGEYILGPATLDGFFIYQTGKLGRQGVAGNGQTVNAFAANLGGRVKAGTGTARVNFLYISGDGNPNHGDRNDFQTIMERSASTPSASAFYPAEMQLLLRNKYAIGTTDKAVVFDLNNAAAGFIGGFVGYDIAIDKFFINSNVGMGAVAKDNRTTGGTDSNYVGTEINTEIGYKLYDNLTASVMVAYVVLGDFYKGKAEAGADPENPYSAKLMFNYVF
jgi:hypothetical protein